MLVFIDESGDPGFRIEQGSTPIFVAAMVTFEDHESAGEADAVIRRALAELRAYPEFKFSKCRDEVRDEFFNRVHNLSFSVRAIVVRKEIIYSPRLKMQKDQFYHYFVRSMLTHDGGLLSGAKVVIDGSGDREFRQALKRYLRRQLGPKLSSIKFQNSRSDALVQLADMCVGAIARSYRDERRNPNRWRKMLHARIDDVWDFK